MTTCKLVIFDCDGTLMDSEPIAARIELELLESYGVTLSKEEFYRRFMGTSSKYVFDTMQEESGRSFPDNHFQELENRMHEALWREAKAVPGAHEMLDQLDQPRCICSNAGLEKLKIELTRAELWDRFRPYVYSAKDVDGVNPKPEPDLFLHAARELETEPRSCIVVEDSPTGVAGAVAAGMRVIGFTGSSVSVKGHSDLLTEAGAETVTNTLLEIPQLIAALEQWEGL